MPRGKKKIQWSAGDLFTVALEDGSRVVGQALDLMMVNIVSVALTRVRVGDGEPLPDLRVISRDQVMAALATWRDPLDTGRWPIVGHERLIVARREWPNEEFRDNNWVGAKHQNTALVEAFLNAYHGMGPWDAWYDPLFFDKLLMSGTTRPANVILTKRSSV
jgi:hypothetical protein